MSVQLELELDPPIVARALGPWWENITGIELAEMCLNNPARFGKYMAAVEPEYRRLRAWHSRNSWRRRMTL